MTAACPHVHAVSAWTLDPETGYWVDADPACRLPSPATLARGEEPRRVKFVKRRNLTV